jgi:hypothetical protein
MLNDMKRRNKAKEYYRILKYIRIKLISNQHQYISSLLYNNEIINNSDRICKLIANKYKSQFKDNDLKNNYMTPQDKFPEVTANDVKIALNYYPTIKE